MCAAIGWTVRRSGGYLLGDIAQGLEVCVFVQLGLKACGCSSQCAVRGATRYGGGPEGGHRKERKKVNKKERKKKKQEKKMDQSRSSGANLRFKLSLETARRLRSWYRAGPQARVRRRSCRSGKTRSCWRAASNGKCQHGVTGSTPRRLCQQLTALSSMYLRTKAGSARARG